MRYLSVCSGIEAATVAWHGLGWTPVAFSEIEAFPSAVLAHHYPDVPNLGDMTALPERILSREVEAPDLFCGGTPCQAFSVAGQRRSLDDARGNLSLTFCEIADAIDHVRRADGSAPCIIFWENVPGVLSTKDNAFGCFLAELAGEDVPLEPPGGKWTDAGVVLGPTRAVAWRVLDAQYFGVAQRRKRVFVVASARDGFDPAEVLLEREGVRRDSAPSREARQGSASGVGGGFEGGSIAGAVTRKWAKGSGGPAGDECYNMVAQPVAHTLRGEGFDAGEDGTGRGTFIVPVAQPVAFPIDTQNMTEGHQSGGLGYGQDGDPSFTLTKGHSHGVAVAQPVGTDCYNGAITGDVAATIGTPGSSVNASGPTVMQAIGLDEEQNACVDGFGTLKARMEGGGFEGSVMTPAMQVRRLTPVECERLQGFPDGYTNIPWRKKDEAPDGPRYKALGNSMAVPCMRWIGERIQAATARQEVKP